MTTTNTFGVVFYIKRQKEKNGKAPIYAGMTVDGKRVEISIKKDIEVDNSLPNNSNQWFIIHPFS